MLINNLQTIMRGLLTLFNVIIIYSLWSSSSINNENDNLKINFEFCSYLKSQSEPETLIYTRIPKTGYMIKYCLYVKYLMAINDKGSTTLENILKSQSMRYNSFLTQVFPKNKWGNLSLAENCPLSKKGSKIAVHGHIYYHNISRQKNYRGQLFEHFTMLRECNSLVKSLLFFNLIGNILTKRIKAGTNEEFNRELFGPYQHWKVEECFMNSNCTAYFFHPNGKGMEMIKKDNSAKFLCGTERAYYSSEVSCALAHLHKEEFTSPGYLAIGIMEYYEESLALLECALPTYFKKSKKYLDKHDNSGVNHSMRDEYPLIEPYIQHYCEESGENLIYETALSIFLNRIRWLKKHPNCCRDKLNL